VDGFIVVLLSVFFRYLLLKICIYTCSVFSGFFWELLSVELGSPKERFVDIK